MTIFWTVCSILVVGLNWRELMALARRWQRRQPYDWAKDRGFRD